MARLGEMDRERRAPRARAQHGDAAHGSVAASWAGVRAGAGLAPGFAVVGRRNANVRSVPARRRRMFGGDGRGSGGATQRADERGPPPRRGERHAQRAPRSVSARAIEPSEIRATVPRRSRSRPKTRAAIGARASSTPAVVATPLPPLKPANGVQTWPSTAASAAARPAPLAAARERVAGERAGSSTPAARPWRCRAAASDRRAPGRASGRRWSRRGCRSRCVRTSTPRASADPQAPRQRAARANAAASARSERRAERAHSLLRTRSRTGVPWKPKCSRRRSAGSGGSCR